MKLYPGHFRGEIVADQKGPLGETLLQVGDGGEPRIAAPTNGDAASQVFGTVFPAKNS